MWCPCSFKFRQGLEMQSRSRQAALPAGLQTCGVYNLHIYVCHGCHSKEGSKLQGSVDFCLQNQVSPWLPLLNFINTSSSSNMGLYPNVNTKVRHNHLIIHPDLLNNQKNLMAHYTLQGLPEDPQAHSIILVIPWGQPLTMNQERTDHS